MELSDAGLKLFISGPLAFCYILCYKHSAEQTSSVSVCNIPLLFESLLYLKNCKTTSLLHTHKLTKIYRAWKSCSRANRTHSPCPWSHHICRCVPCWCPVWCRDLNTLVSTGPGWAHQPGCCPLFPSCCSYKPHFACWNAAGHRSAPAKGRDTDRHGDCIKMLGFGVCL